MNRWKLNTIFIYWLIVATLLVGTWYVLAKVTHWLLFSEVKIEYREPKGGVTIEPLPSPTITPNPTPTPVVFDGVTTASWYSQENLIPRRKNLAGDSFGVAMRNPSLGGRFVVCLRTDPKRCIDVVHNDYCEGCNAQFTNRAFDLQKEAFAELSPLQRGVIEVVYKKI